MASEEACQPLVEQNNQSGRSTATHATKYLASGHGIATKHRIVAYTVIHSISIVIVWLVNVIVIIIVRQ
jgi:t-SNARE complex subunit (syntaxin)